MTVGTGAITDEEGRGEAFICPRLKFSLLRWFSILSLVAILVIGAGVGLFLTRYLTGHMLTRDAELSRDFIESIVSTEKTYAYLENPEMGAPSDVLDKFVEHIPFLPDVVRANLYGSDRTVLWSSDKQLVGRRFSDNDDLERAFRDELVVESGRVASDATKPEHVGLAEKAGQDDKQRFVEAYLPIRDEAGKTVVAVVEIYKLPRALFAAIDEGVAFVWMSAAIGGAILYTAFFWIVRRADIVMRSQRERLVEAETLAAIGEMAAAVAHGIRNPLASIRSAAELADEEDAEGARECHRDIMRQADRLDVWVRELLVASRGGALPVEDIDVNRLLRDALAGASPEIRRRNIEVVLAEAPVPTVRGSRAPLAHALGSLIANAIEAMPDGGRLGVESRHGKNGAVEILVEDSGSGMPESVAREAFRPLFTTKPNGTGLGLSLARRILERHSGRLELETSEGRGTRATMSLPAMVV
jgi:two-component system sensor histidine kinase HydH